MTQQSELWEGSFGDLYQERNIPSDENVLDRLKFWTHIYKCIYANCGAVPRSVLEIGAGQGPNLMALEKLSINMAIPIKLSATEINEGARLKLAENSKQTEIISHIPTIEYADLVFTYGVMIHTHPAHLRDLQNKIYGASKRWIISVEYFSPDSTPVVYRGEKDALWKDDYGSKWLSYYSLRLITYGFAWKPQTGLDNVTFWVFEKTEKMT